MGYFNNKTGILTVNHLCYAITLDTIGDYKKSDNSLNIMSTTKLMAPSESLSLGLSYEYLCPGVSIEDKNFISFSSSKFW